MDLADSTHVVVGDVPPPGSDRVPLSNFDLHCDNGELAAVGSMSSWVGLVDRDIVVEGWMRILL
jgi:hypothetical protein